MENLLKGRVVEVINDCKIVIDKGSRDGVKENQLFLIYKFGKEIFDPETNESLGVLEIICGEGKTIHIQERITTLVTANVEHTKITTKRISKNMFGDTIESTEPETTQIPFDNVSVGCLFKQIK